MALQNLIYTASKARLRLFSSNNEKNYNWLFLPGGPGLGSESLSGLMEILHLPGSMWYLDLPGDGSNTTEDDAKTFSHWATALLEATGVLKNVILVAHSSGGMFALATSDLEKNLLGLVLMDSAPDAGWQQVFAQYIEDCRKSAKLASVADIEKLQRLYLESPNNLNLKAFTIASAPYFSTKAGLAKITEMLKNLPFNYKTHLWAEKYFDPVYKACWTPVEIPTLIFAGDEDHITPLKLFTDAPAFQRPNITIRAIRHASHFPWIDNPSEVKQCFAEFCRVLESCSGTLKG